MKGFNTVKTETIVTQKEAGYSSIKAYGELVNFGKLVKEWTLI